MQGDVMKLVKDLGMRKATRIVNVIIDMAYMNVLIV
jgi:hypothetical protein